MQFVKIPTHVKPVTPDFTFGTTYATTSEHHTVFTATTVTVSRVKVHIESKMVSV